MHSPDFRAFGGAEVGFLPQHAEGLEHATVADLEKIEITPSGYGIHFPKLDADLSCKALLAAQSGWPRISAVSAEPPAAAPKPLPPAKRQTRRPSAPLPPLEPPPTF